jgi:hypothetical protein
MEHSQIVLGLSLVDWEHVAKVAAVIGALTFFSYKVVSGYLITNMSIRLSCLRQPTSDVALDDLVFSVTLIKGDRGTVAIHDASARLFDDAGTPIATVALYSAARQSYKSERFGAVDRKCINWVAQSTKSPFLNLSPGEEMTLASRHRISSAIVCRVDAIVLGRRTTSSYVAQWRGCAIALPLTPKQRRDVA